MREFTLKSPTKESAFSHLSLSSIDLKVESHTFAHC